MKFHLVYIIFLLLLPGWGFSQQEESPELKTGVQERVCTSLADYKAQNSSLLGELYGLPEIPDTLPGLCPNEMAVLEKAPQALNLDSIKRKVGFPPKAYWERIQGRVILRLRINENGETTHCVILKDPHEILTAAVLKHIFQLRWTPAMLNGKKVACWENVPFEFMILD